MQREVSNQVSNTVNEAANAPEFHQMADGMKKAIGDFEDMQNEDIFSTVSSYLAPIGDACVRSWNSATSFVRRHPVETSVAVGCIGLLCAYMMMPTRGATKSSRRSKNA